MFCSAIYEYFVSTLIVPNPEFVAILLKTQNCKKITVKYKTFNTFIFYSVGLSIVRRYKLNKTLKSSIKLCTSTKTLIKNIC